MDGITFYHWSLTAIVTFIDCDMTENRFDEHTTFDYNIQNAVAKVTNQLTLKSIVKVFTV